jgi:hypothetical protein
MMTVKSKLTAAGALSWVTSDPVSVSVVNCEAVPTALAVGVSSVNRTRERISVALKIRRMVLSLVFIIDYSSGNSITTGINYPKQLALETVPIPIIIKQAD